MYDVVYLIRAQIRTLVRRGCRLIGHSDNAVRELPVGFIFDLGELPTDPSEPNSSITHQGLPEVRTACHLWHFVRFPGDLS